MKFINLTLAFLGTLLVGVLAGILASLFGWSKFYTEVCKPAPREPYGARGHYEDARSQRVAKIMAYGVGSMDDVEGRYNIARRVSRREKELLNKIQDLHFEEPVPPVNQVFQNTRKLLLTRYDVD